jgi:hypothetical protein
MVESGVDDFTGQQLRPEKRSKVPIIGRLIDRREMQKRVRDFDITTPEGLDKEYDLIEATTGMTLESRPGVRLWSMSGSSYDFQQNIIDMQTGLTRAERRWAFWHEASHALLRQNPIWQQMVKETITAIEAGSDKYPETFLTARDVVLEEGLARFIMIPAMEKISPYMEGWERDSIVELNREAIQAIIPQQFLKWALSIQKEIEEAVAEAETYSVPSQEVDQLAQILLWIEKKLAKQKIIFLYKKFSRGGHYMGTNYILRVAREQGLKTPQEVISAITSHPPRSWEELLGITKETIEKDNP